MAELKIGTENQNRKISTKPRKISDFEQNVGIEQRIEKPKQKD